MKRSFQEMQTPGQQEQQIVEDERLYGAQAKRRKMEGQKVGIFIVNALDVFHFKLVSDPSHLDQASGEFFAPKFTHQLFGEKEQIRGFEGLSINVYLSSKRLVPLVEVSFEKKAPSFAAIDVDDLDEKLKQAFTTYYTDRKLYETEVLAKEKTADVAAEFGEEFCQLSGGQYRVMKVNVTNVKFASQNDRIQALLPFFIDAASAININTFWDYFLVWHVASGDLACFQTMFHPHKSADRYRAKISQVLVMPPFQRRGLASQMYDKTYAFYRSQPNCEQILVEDAADAFQVIMDVVNTKVLVKHIGAQHDPIVEAGQVPVLGTQQVKELARVLKLPDHVILRLQDLLTYSRIKAGGGKEAVVRAFRLSVKRRLYIRCVKIYPELFKTTTGPLAKARQNGLSQPYIWNGLLDDNQFACQDEQGEQAKNPMDALTQEATKMQLETMYKQLITEFLELQPKVQQILSN